MLKLIEDEIVAFVGVWMFFLMVSCCCSCVTFIGSAVLSLFVTTWAMRAYTNLKPRNIIPIIRNKSVVITGCDSGFGKSLAERIYELGFKVYAGCLFPEGEGAQELKKSCPNINILKLDVTSDSETEDAVKAVQEGISRRGESLWCIVNNAGIACISEIEWCSLDMFNKVHQVNTIGTVRVTKAFLPLLKKTQGSRVVNVASLAGRLAPAAYCPYTMSKFAVLAFSDVLRIEMKKWGISVHTIEPTLYKTAITDIRQILGNLDKLWNASPEHIKKAYGEEYFQEFKDGVEPSLKRARPFENIVEVVDDMVDAVAGAQPKTQYVPAAAVRVKYYILSYLPTKITDVIFNVNCPKVLPAECRKF